MSFSFQLYSARNFTPWADVIASIAKLGYTQVEGFGGVYENPAEFKDLLDRHGLTMPSGHFFPLASCEDEFVISIAAAKTLGIQKIFCPAPDQELQNGATRADWNAYAARLYDVGKRVQDAGIAFGWHNHHWEFMPLADGTLPMNILLENAPDIEWEMDVAWVIRGGHDPMQWIADHGARITAAHVKDIAPEGECEDEDGWADVGQGTMDWAALIAALRAHGVTLFVAEHDNPSDVTRFATRSIEAFRTY